MSTNNLTNSPEILLRLSEAVAKIGVNKTQIAIQTGYSKATVGAVLEGKTPVTSKFIKIFCSTYKISEPWIETGEGEIFVIPGNHDTLKKLTVAEMIGEGYSPEVKIVADYLQLRIEGKTREERLKEIDEIMEDIRKRYK